MGADRSMLEECFQRYDQLLASVRENQNSNNNNNNNNEENNSPPTATMQRWIAFPGREERYMVDRIMFAGFAKKSGRPKFVILHQVMYIYRFFSSSPSLPIPVILIWLLLRNDNRTILNRRNWKWR